MTLLKELCAYAWYSSKLKPLFLYLTYTYIFLYLAELMYLCLNKLAGKYGKIIVLIFYILCIKFKECQSHHFPIHS